MAQFKPIKNFDQDGNPKIVVISNPDQQHLTKKITDKLDKAGIEYEILNFGNDIDALSFKKLCVVTRTFPVLFEGDREVTAEELTK